ncbi:hypothetical protein [Pseudomonas sp. S2_C03]
MKASIAVFCGFMCVCTFAVAEQQPTEKQATGSIVFSEKGSEGGKTCSVPFITQPAVDFTSDNYGCVNDEYSYFRLNDAPSAGQFQLSSENCRGGEAWWFWLDTYINPISTDWIYIGDLSTFQKGDIVRRGITLDSKRTNTTVPFKGKLSCVRIIRSPVP